MAYVGNQPVPQATQTRDRFVATSGQTSFATSGYTPNFVDVYLDGVKLDSSEYTATNGSDVVLASGASTGQIMEVIAQSGFNASEKLPDQTSHNGKYLTTDGSALSWGTVTAPTPAAVSDQSNTSTGFFAFPVGTTAQRPSSPAVGYVRYNTDVAGLEEYRDGQWIVLSNKFSAQGGTEVTSGGYTYHVFTTSGSFIADNNGSIEYIVGAGGGGGGGSGDNWTNGGGGGAGGFIYGSADISSGTFSVVIGAGGAGGSTLYNNGVQSGSNTTFAFNATTAIGGGHGGAYSASSGASGGSGGGAPGNNNNLGTGTTGQGSNGGSGGSYANSSSTSGAGGGGGKGSAGANHNGSNGGNGGSGTTSYSTWATATSTGVSSGYAGGGGGGGAGGTGGSGSHGGGTGGSGASNSGVTAGSTNSCGGGGGSSDGITGDKTGGNGGSGIVIIRYPS